MATKLAVKPSSFILYAAVTVGCYISLHSTNLSATLPANDEFTGIIKTEAKDSVPDWPDPVQSRPDAPNILIWMLDDAGIGHIGAFGSMIETPNLDKLSQQGLRFSNFHATPVCSASRASLLTGRNPHRVHMGAHAGGAIGFPGYDAHIPNSMGTIADILQAEGYTTMAIGKWDHLPGEDSSPAGPFDYWPSGQGFDRFYGFLAADTDNFQPALWADHTPVELPAKDSYHLSEDMADKAIQWIDERNNRPTQPPFFMYWATGAVHAPHHAPTDTLAYYRGRFDQGWDNMREQILAKQKTEGIIPSDTPLPPLPAEIPAWKSLSEQAQQSYARAMEALAAQMTYTDQQFGRILNHLETIGELENTLVIVLSDNGASAEGGLHGTFNESLFFNSRQTTVEQNLHYFDRWGGPDTYPHVPVGWGIAGNTPFRYYKQTAYEGGTRVPLIMTWPQGIQPAGEIRDQYHFITDIVPTILSATRLKQPTEINGVSQAGFDGIDMSYTFNSATENTQRQFQYVEKIGNRSIYKDGWKAVNKHRVITWEIPLDLKLHNNWELYHIEKDINEMNNLADSQPDKLNELVSLFEEQAHANNVYPIISAPGALGNFILTRSLKQIKQRHGLYIYRQQTSRIPETLSPILGNRAFHATAQIQLEQDSTQLPSGPIFAIGGRHGGMTLFLSDGKPHFVFKNVDKHDTAITSTQTLPSGLSSIELFFQPNTTGANATLKVNGETVAAANIPGPLPYTFSLHETFDVGSDSGSLVTNAYAQSPRLEDAFLSLQVQVAIPDKH